jgi:hypothetical protein
VVRYGHRAARPRCERPFFRRGFSDGWESRKSLRGTHHWPWEESGRREAKWAGPWASRLPASGNGPFTRRRPSSRGNLAPVELIVLVRERLRTSGARSPAVAVDRRSSTPGRMHDLPHRHGQRRDRSLPPSPLPPLSERRRELCSSGPNEWPALLEDLAGLGWGVDRRDLAERVGQRLFHTPAPPDDQLGLPLVLGEQGRDHFER